MRQSLLGFDFFIWLLTGAYIIAIVFFCIDTTGAGLAYKVFISLFTVWAVFIAYLIIQKRKKRYQRRDYVPSWGITYKFITGMKAISNNLPQLTEAIKKYRELEATGKI